MLRRIEKKIPEDSHRDNKVSAGADFALKPYVRAWYLF